MLISKKVEKLMEEMGFVYEDENRWCASFIFGATGNIINIVGFVHDDKYGIPVMCFRSYDENDNLLAEFTFDQLLMSYENDMQSVPVKSNNKYLASYNLTVSVPVDMSKMSSSKFTELLLEGHETEEEIAQSYAREKLMDYLTDTDMYVIEFQSDDIEEVD